MKADRIVGEDLLLTAAAHQQFPPAQETASHSPGEVVHAGDETILGSFRSSPVGLKTAEGPRHHAADGHLATPSATSRNVGMYRVQVPAPDLSPCTGSDTKLERRIKEMAYRQHHGVHRNFHWRIRRPSHRHRHRRRSTNYSRDFLDATQSGSGQTPAPRRSR